MFLERTKKWLQNRAFLSFVILICGAGVALAASSDLYNTYPKSGNYVYDQDGVTKAPVGWVVQVIYADGGVIHAPNPDGTPGGGDTLVDATSRTIGNLGGAGYFYYPMQYMTAGKQMYLRAWNSASIEAGSFYGDSTLSEVITLSAPPAIKKWELSSFSIKTKRPLPPPTISSITWDTSNPDNLKNAGYVYGTINVNGTNFGNTQETNTVEFRFQGGAYVTVPAAKIYWWQNDKIQIGVPQSIATTYAAAGNTDVQVTINSKTASGSFVLKPKVYGVTPVTGPVGTSIKISGTALNPVAASNSVSFNGTSAAASSLQQGAEISTIEVTVPVGAANGQLLVTANGQTSNTHYDWGTQEQIVFTVTMPFISNFNITKGGDAIGSAVTATWQIEPANAPVDIYVKAGTFSSNPAEWTRVQNGVTITSYTDANQIGQGTAKYYKVVPMGVTLQSTDLTREVMGKFDLALKEGFNLISLPLVNSGNASIGSVIGTQLAGNIIPPLADKVYQMKADQSGYLQAWLNSADHQWYDPETGAGSTINVVPDTGYWVEIAAGNGAKNVTVVGLISDTSRGPLGVKTSFNLVGTTYPTGSTLASSGLAQSGATAGIIPPQACKIYALRADQNGCVQAWLSSADNQWYDPETGALSTITLTPGQGYWIDEPTKNFNWSYPKPY